MENIFGKSMFQLLIPISDAQVESAFLRNGFAMEHLIVEIAKMKTMNFVNLWEQKKGVFERGNCPSLHFECDSKCIPESFRCDKHKDCLNGQDEVDCDESNPLGHVPRLVPSIVDTIPKAIVCKDDEFQCQHFAACIPTQLQCNGRRDCRDGTDEMNCEATTIEENKMEKTRNKPSAQPSYSKSETTRLTSTVTARTIIEPQSNNSGSAFISSATALSGHPINKSVIQPRATFIMRDAIRSTKLTVASPVSAVDNKPRRMPHRTTSEFNSVGSTQTPRRLS
ncbi:Basement membrane-specific heparan sulfate proteoglycan core protein [Aphelenchoides besseyi]|nr:Basement membrane-specific heparan sulfate proteoglycan core protein [Aphelenchoides besseyi]